MNPFKNKVAVVTGGASGIGKALCEELSDRGSIVMVADINAEGAGKVASAISRRGGRAHAAHVDVSDEISVSKLIVRYLRNSRVSRTPMLLLPQCNSYLDIADFTLHNHTYTA